MADKKKVDDQIVELSEEELEQVSGGHKKSHHHHHHCNCHCHHHHYTHYYHCHYCGCDHHYNDDCD